MYADAIADVLREHPKHALPRAEVLQLLREVGLSEQAARAVLGFGLRHGHVAEVAAAIRPGAGRRDVDLRDAARAGAGRGARAARSGRGGDR